MPEYALSNCTLCGGFGSTFFRGDCDRLLAEYIKLGVTSCQMCSGCQPWETIEKIVETVRSCRVRDSDASATLLGAYWEGPFQHPDRTAEGHMAGSGLLLPDHLRNLEIGRTCRGAKGT